jgi:predicted transcriptional regulator
LKEIEKNSLTLIWKLKRQSNAGAIIISDFELYYRATETENSIVLAQKIKCRSMKKNTG